MHICDWDAASINIPRGITVQWARVSYSALCGIPQPAVKPAPIVLINVGRKVIVSLSKMFREVAVVTRGVVEQADVNASQADKKSIYEEAREAREATPGGAGTSRDHSSALAV